MAALELPEDRWPELISALLANMNAQDAAVKQATLETLGYVCEEAVALEEEVFAQEQVNSILTAVVAGMHSGQSDAVRLAAIVALQNALEFAETNFENVRERDYLMQIVLEATLASDLRVKEAAFECLAGIASLHYHKLQAYINDIFSLTQQAINTGEEQVAKQAIEFWCTICDEELELDEVGFRSPSCIQTAVLSLLRELPDLHVRLHSTYPTDRHACATMCTITDISCWPMHLKACVSSCCGWQATAWLLPSPGCLPPCCQGKSRKRQAWSNHACLQLRSSLQGQARLLLCCKTGRLTPVGLKEGEGEARSQRFAQQALQPLVPVLLAQLTKQEEDQDKDQGIWNLSMAAGTCLMLFATVVGDPIIPLVLPYVQVLHLQASSIYEHVAHSCRSGLMHASGGWGRQDGQARQVHGQ